MSIQMIITTTLIQRTLDRDVHGMKIPDNAVDNLLYELTQRSNQYLHQIEISLNVNPSLYAKRAYRLWALGALNLSTVFSDVPETFGAIHRAA